MRQVLLIRHGTAEAAAFGGDAARALTDEGRADIAAVGRGLCALGFRPEALWHSPFARTSETAALLAHELSVAAEALRIDPALVPGGSPERVARAILEAEARCLVCVSHMPLLPQLVARLVGARTEFGTGTVAHLGMVGPHGAALFGLWSATLLARVR